MDAGTSAILSSNRARQRQQLLNSENDIEALSESIMQQPTQQQQQQQQQPIYQPAYMQQPYVPHNNSFNSNSTYYDMSQNNGGSFTSVSSYNNAPPPQTGSRKSSLTSQSGVHRLFRRNKTDTFNEDAGVDVYDLTNGNSVSFDDISHIRGDRGRYGVNAAKALDSEPIIPTLSSNSSIPSSNLSGPRMNNIQYRKQMNYQKKLALMNGARANSLAGGNPMQFQQGQQQQQQPGYDPRSMSLGGHGRAQSLNTASLPQQGPRSMSMRSGPYPNQQYGGPPPQQYQQYPPVGPGQGPPPGQGPRSMSLRQYQQQPYQQQQPPSGAPRSMSLMNNGNPRLQQQGMPVPQQYPSSRSLNSQSPRPPYTGQQPPPPPQQQQQFKSQNLVRGDPVQFIQNQSQGPPPQPIQQAPLVQQLQPPPSQQQPLEVESPLDEREELSFSLPHLQYEPTYNSSDSLMNVPEEEEPADEPNEDDVYKVNKAEIERVPSSRKSTIKGRNSMRVRKLNLFNQDDKAEEKSKPVEHNPIEHKPLEYKPLEHKPLRRKPPSPGPLEEKFSVDKFTKSLPEIPQQIEEHVEKEDLNKIELQDKQVDDEGDDEDEPDQTFTPTNSIDQDLSFQSNISNELPSPDLDKSDVDTIQQRITEEHPANPIKEEYSPHRVVIPQSGPRKISNDSIRKIVANTAFVNFRSPSSNTTPKFANKFNEVIDSPTSVYENDTIAGNSVVSSVDNSFHDSSNENKSCTPPSVSPSESKDSVDSDVKNPNLTLYNTLTEPIVNPMEEEKLNPLPTTPSQEQKRSFDIDDISTSPSQHKYENDEIQTTPTQHIRTKTKSSTSLSSSNSIKQKHGSFNIFKRLSRSSRKSSITESLSTKKQSNAPLHFTKEEMGIMTSNNELLSELELVTTELALSIKRELALETKLRSGNTGTQDASVDELEKELSNSRKLISDLQEKLTKERRLRFISEEHALLSEHGQSPSPLKLNYENTELYKQLLIKNDEIKQLEDKIAEYEQNQKSHGDLVDKYNELLEENTELKFNVIPSLQRKLEEHKNGSSSRKFNIVGDKSMTEEAEDEEISRLRSQRDELRSTVNRLTRNNDLELKSAQEKIRTLEGQLRDIKRINDKLTIREDSKTNGFIKNGGGKLSGLAIISSNQNIFD